MISLLISLPRIITIYRESANLLKKSFTHATVDDVLVRAFVLMLFSWTVLQFNTNLRKYIEEYKPFVLHTLTLLINVFFIYAFTTLLFTAYPKFADDVISRSEKLIIYFTYIVVFFILFFIAKVLKYQSIYQQQVQENQILKQQVLKNELTALKNQVNPHFLFNSLNTLNSLIRFNKKASTFIHKLSYMYRYILQSSDSDLVSVERELKFLESFVFLLKTRFQDKLIVDISIDPKYLDTQIPPLALQLLVENAVKHNEVSAKHPLKVAVYSDQEGYINVVNEIRLRSQLEDSTGNGLSNLNQRYLLLKQVPLIISSSDNQFKVRFKIE